ncbi:rhodanese [Tenacibaculum soleae]|uniref:Rhodanese n=1 Tax=Tenacibaculum soleae TaxID=447689 RepID=A0A1B9Y1P8_9FLAO|nr:rhodanese-like domain-containing protein [Tenacibaculum soleae]OCK43722.1 rhodanese [Tenacibaculum soleae]
MKHLILFFLLISFNSFSQKDLHQLLKKYNTENVPYIFVDSLKTIASDVVLLDAREPKEFNVSHLKNAICVGYDDFNITKTTKILSADKNIKIVVYCSLGIRSENVAEQLKKAGFKNVYNLYGGIFEWKNKKNTVVNSKNIPTNKVHTFNKEWSKWLLKGEKIYE